MLVQREARPGTVLRGTMLAQQPKGFYMRAREHGHGPYADMPLRFVSIEKMKEALAQFFDKHLQVSASAR